jgi:hypothetical protein
MVTRWQVIGTADAGLQSRMAAADATSTQSTCVTEISSYTLPTHYSSELARHTYPPSSCTKQTRPSHPEQQHNTHAALHDLNTRHTLTQAKLHVP